MSYKRQIWFLLGSTALMCVGVWYIRSADSATSQGPQYIVSEHVTPEISAESWLVFDLESGEIIQGKNQEEILPIASVTKLMTAEVAVSTLDLDATTTVSWSAVQSEGNSGRLSAGEKIQTRELLFPLLIESSNDAAEAISEEYKGKGFLPSAMTNEAKLLGMEHTVFRDASGLSEGNISTALDLSILLRHVFTKKRYLLDITTLPQYVGREHDWLNNNPVHGEWGYLGGKHGYTEEAGRTFVGIFRESLKGGDEREIGVVLLRSEDIRRDVRSLRSYLREQVAYAYIL